MITITVQIEDDIFEQQMHAYNTASGRCLIIFHPF